MLGKSPKNEVFLMNAACEARSLVEVIAGPQRVTDGVKNALSYVARRTGLTERRIRAFWNTEARAIRADEMDALRVAAQRAEAKKNADHRAHLAQELRRAAERLAVVDEAYFQPHIDELRARANALLGLVDGRGLTPATPTPSGAGEGGP